MTWETVSNYHTHFAMQQSASIRQGGGLAFGIDNSHFDIKTWFTTTSRRH
jgi:hypothetical protein